MILYILITIIGSKIEIFEDEKSNLLDFNNLLQNGILKKTLIKNKSYAQQIDYIIKFCNIKFCNLVNDLNCLFKKQSIDLKQKLKFNFFLFNSKKNNHIKKLIQDLLIPLDGMWNTRERHLLREIEYVFKVFFSNLKYIKEIFQEIQFRESEKNFQRIMKIKRKYQGKFKDCSDKGVKNLNCEIKNNINYDKRHYIIKEKNENLNNYNYNFKNYKLQAKDNQDKNLNDEQNFLIDRNKQTKSKTDLREFISFENNDYEIFKQKYLHVVKKISKTDENKSLENVSTTNSKDEETKLQENNQKSHSFEEIDVTIINKIRALKSSEKFHLIKNNEIYFYCYMELFTLIKNAHLRINYIFQKYEEMITLFLKNGYDVLWFKLKNDVLKNNHAYFISAEEFLLEKYNEMKKNINVCIKITKNELFNCLFY